YFPYSKLADPTSETGELEVQSAAWDFGAAFPLSFSNGRIVILNQFKYKRIDFRYRNHPAGPEIEQAQSIEHTFFLVDSLSQTWKMIAVLTPGFASDFEAKVSSDDFTLTGVFGFIWKFRENFDIGFGAAYMRDFGAPIPLPFLYFDWNNGGRMHAKGILPQNMDVLYDLSPKMSLGLSFKISGNRYHGNPDKYGVDNPQLKYSEGTISQIAQVHFTDWCHLDVEGGFAFYRNFEFMDGDEPVQSLDLNRTGYLRARIILGI
ncbi:MAG TPA: DUF6268 family outer membrane beta-barrel protein, partial [Candidatus Krumholzibacterium sp.]|nr:DUF6268 family outer membrane beta-barrel protein [Candidatus Krumholzibacterium sp.]